MFKALFCVSVQDQSKDVSVKKTQSLLNVSIKCLSCFYHPNTHKRIVAIGRGQYYGLLFVRLCEHPTSLIELFFYLPVFLGFLFINNSAVCAYACSAISLKNYNKEKGLLQ